MKCLQLAREQNLGEAVEREKRRRHAATGDFSVESSEVGGGRIEKQQKFKSKRKKINKNDLNNEENEDSLKLSNGSDNSIIFLISYFLTFFFLNILGKHQLEQIYGFLKNKHLFECKK